MISHLKIQEQDVWEAWIEFDQHSNHFGTLYISGEILASSGRFDARISVEDTIYGRQLLLVLPERVEGRSRIREFLYSEAIQNPFQYNAICIYAGDELLARFGEIEILI